jgi:hypothetical protein
VVEELLCCTHSCTGECGGNVEGRQLSPLSPSPQSPLKAASTTSSASTSRSKSAETEQKLNHLEFTMGCTSFQEESYKKRRKESRLLVLSMEKHDTKCGRGVLHSQLRLRMWPQSCNELSKSGNCDRKTEKRTLLPWALLPQVTLMIIDIAQR